MGHVALDFVCGHAFEDAGAALQQVAAGASQVGVLDLKGILGRVEQLCTQGMVPSKLSAWVCEAAWSV